jgi:hypothetical protein
MEPRKEPQKEYHLVTQMELTKEHYLENLKAAKKESKKEDHLVSQMEPRKEPK